MVLRLKIDTDVISVAEVTELLNLAGKFVGIGYLRPQDGRGMYGRFSAELMS